MPGRGTWSSPLRIAAAAFMGGALALPFVATIKWYPPGWHSPAEARSLAAHAIWWLRDASFGPWYLPIAVVVPPPVLVLIAALLRLGRGRVVVAMAAAVLAWMGTVIAIADVGEDIVFSWIRMPGPLAVEALLASAFAATTVVRLRARRRELGGQE